MPHPEPLPLMPPEPGHGAEGLCRGDDLAQLAPEGPAMRVLLIVTQLEVAGAQTAARILKRQLLRAGHEAELVFLYEKNSRAYPERDYVTLHAGRPGSMRDYLRIIVALYRVWNAYRPDAVLARTHYSVALMILGKLLGLPGAGIAVQANISSYGSRVVRAIDWLGGVTGLARRIVVVSPGAAESFAGYPAAYRRRMRVIPNGVDRPTFVPDRQRWRQRLCVAPSTFLIGSAGRLVAQKNHAFLIALAAAMPDVEVAIAGEGPLEDALKQQAVALGIQHRIHVLGAVDHADMPDFYAALDLFALPSRHEGRSNALLEALSFGVPVTGSAVPTVADLLDGAGGQAGLALPIEIEAWRQEIMRVKDDSAYREGLRAGARRLADAFGVEAMTAAYLQVIREAQPVARRTAR